jgi:23S rRNA (cytidine1920-2'-O)/16S rRNA (cytidine1409-2'-O)-methyltransferase
VARKSGEKTRLDALLVARGLADDLTEARALAMAGKVVAGDQRLDKPGALISADTPLRLKDAGRYVSRGGDKLAAALKDFGLEGAVKDAVVLDIGASTGGFTQCCLELGARQVLAVDVGTSQLAWELRQDPRVTVLERTDVRNFTPDAHPAAALVVADVSFNSLARLAPAVAAAAPAATDFVLLVKPQFELGRDEVPDGGIVVDQAARQSAVERVVDAFQSVGLAVRAHCDSRVAGRGGNVEVFLHLARAKTPSRAAPRS